MAAAADPAHGPTRTMVRAAVAVLTAVAILLMWPFRGAIVFGATFGFALYPLQARLQRKVRPGISGMLVLLMATVAIVAPVAAVAWALRSQAREVFITIQQEGVRNLLRDILATIGVPSRFVDDAVDRATTELVGFAQGLAAEAIGAVSHVILALILFYVVFYYVLVDGPSLIDFLRRVTPIADVGGHDLLTAAGERMKALVYGNLLTALVQGVVAGTGWWLLGLPNPLFWGGVMTVLSIIPVIGAFVVLLPAAAWAFLQGLYVAGIGLLILNFIAVGLIDDLLRPIIIGRWSAMHPAIVLIGIAGGIPLFGLSGLIVGPLLLGLLGPAFDAWGSFGEEVKRERERERREANGLEPEGAE